MVRTLFLRTCFTDTATELKFTEELLGDVSENSNGIRLLPKNATDLFQPADSLVIWKLEFVWRSAWDQKRTRLVELQPWTSCKNGSRKLPNPVKKFYVEVARRIMENMNFQRDSDVVLYTQKAMTRCGLALNLSGR